MGHDEKTMNCGLNAWPTRDRAKRLRGRSSSDRYDEVVLIKENTTAIQNLTWQDEAANVEQTSCYH